MNPVLAEIYSAVVPSAPYIIAAYALIWAVLLVWIFTIFRKQKKISQQLDVIEGLLKEKSSKNSETM